MAPGPKKRSFHTPRNPKNNQATKHDKTDLERSDDTNKKPDKISESIIVTDNNVTENKKYSKRTIESNWNKYNEPLIGKHDDSLRGDDFEAVLSCSGGSGSQLKLQEEKEWEEDCVDLKDISLNFKDLINTMKCIPFHERIKLKNVFDENHIKNFVLRAEYSKKCYKSQNKTIEPESIKLPLVDPVINIIEEPNFLEPEEISEIKTFVVQDKTENIINSLASSLTFKKAPEKKDASEKKPDTASDLDFLLTLNIPSKISTDNKDVETQSTPNVDDWLNSILDD